MTIVLVILAVLILLAVLFLINRVNKVSNRILSTMIDDYAGLVNHYLSLEKSIKENYTDIKDYIVELIKSINAHSGVSNTKHDKIVEVISNINTILKAPIDKINDVHNRVKTLNSVVPDKAYLDTLRDSAVKAIIDKLYEAPDKVYFTALGEQIVKDIVNSIAQSQSKPQPISAPETEVVNKSKKQPSKTKKTETKN